MKSEEVVQVTAKVSKECSKSLKKIAIDKETNQTDIIRDILEKIMINKNKDILERIFPNKKVGDEIVS